MFRIKWRTVAFHDTAITCSRLVGISASIRKMLPIPIRSRFGQYRPIPNTGISLSLEVGLWLWLGFSLSFQQLTLCYWKFLQFFQCTLRVQSHFAPRCCPLCHTTEVLPLQCYLRPVICIEVAYFYRKGRGEWEREERDKGKEREGVTKLFL